MRIAVLVTLYRRPNLSRKVLDALANCYGFEDADIFISLDGAKQNGDENRVGAVAGIAAEWCSKHSQRLSALIGHGENVGIDVHKLLAFKELFSLGYDYICHLEDDMVPARDFLRFHQWAAEHYANDQNILCNVAYNNAGLEYTQSHYRYGVIITQHPCCWGWGVWHDRWQDVIGNELRYRQWAGDKVNGMFDHWWMMYAISNHKYVIAPRLARVQNLVGDPTSIERGENWQDPSEQEMIGFNKHGSWDLPDHDPSMKEWHEGD